MMRLAIEVSAGELYDKISILELKAEFIADPDQRAHVLEDLAGLAAVRDQNIAPSARLAELVQELAQVNRKLWHVEDAIRDCERDKQFGERFRELARSVYIQNDLRAATKRAIDALLGSRIVEIKTYRPYRG